MPQLIKDLFEIGSPFSRVKKLFGLESGQKRQYDYIHNGSWFNNSGEKIGSGDLSPDDLRKIAQELWSEQFFIILSEKNSIELGNSTDLNYLAQKCSFVITRNKLFYVDEAGNYTGHTFRSIYGLEFIVIPREAVRRMLQPW